MVQTAYNDRQTQASQEFRPFVAVDIATSIGRGIEEDFAISVTAGAVKSLSLDGNGLNGNGRGPELKIVPHKAGLLRVTLSVSRDHISSQQPWPEPEVALLEADEPLTGETLVGGYDWQATSLLTARTNRQPLVVVGGQIVELVGAFRRNTNPLAPRVASVINAAYRSSGPT